MEGTKLNIVHGSMKGKNEKMGLNKNGYYTLKDIMPHNADYNIILSGRSIGKSYATEFEERFTYIDDKEEEKTFIGALREAWETKTCTLAYIRRMAGDWKYTCSSDLRIPGSVSLSDTRRNQWYRYIRCGNRYRSSLGLNLPFRNG